MVHVNVFRLAQGVTGTQKFQASVVTKGELVLSSRPVSGQSLHKHEVGGGAGVN